MSTPSLISTAKKQPHSDLTSLSLPEGSISDLEKSKEIGSSSNDDCEVEDDTVEYPQGVKLLVIALALILSIFLASLDMVEFSSKPCILKLTSRVDNCRHSDTKNQRRIPRPG